MRSVREWMDAEGTAMGTGSAGPDFTRSRNPARRHRGDGRRTRPVDYSASQNANLVRTPVNSKS